MTDSHLRPSDSEIDRVNKSCREYLHAHGPRLPHKQMWEATNAVDPQTDPDVYGLGAEIGRFEAKLAKMFGHESAVFMPSGTMAQQIAGRIWADRAGSKTIMLHPTSHLELHEQDGYKILHGLEPVFVGDHTECMNVDLLEKSFRSSVPKPASLIIELPQRHGGGALPEWDELVNMSAWCKRNQVAFHMDGARAWEAQVYYKKTLAELGSLFDSAYTSFYKGVGGIAGAALFGDRDFIAESRIWQRRHGGELIHLYPYIAAAEAGMKKYLPLMGEYRLLAGKIAEHASQAKNWKLVPNPPQVNMMHFLFDADPGLVERAALETSKETGVWILRRLWQRDFSSPNFELYVGEAARELGIERIAKVLSVFDDHIGELVSK